MESSASKSSNAQLPAALEEKVRHLPVEARAALARFHAQRDLEAVDTVVFAIVEDFAHEKPSTRLAEMPPETNLIEDLGYDSLAISELVFFTEDLFGISIANEEILRVRTTGDLRAFVRSKLVARNAA